MENTIERNVVNSAGLVTEYAKRCEDGLVLGSGHESRKKLQIVEITEIFSDSSNI